MWNKTNYLYGFRSPSKINSSQISLRANKRLNERTETRTRVCAWVGTILEIMCKKRNHARFANDSFAEHFDD